MKIAHINKNTGELLGWYSHDIHKNIPEPYIEVKEDVWQSALETNANAYENGQFVVKDFRTQQEITDDLAVTERQKRDSLIDEVEWRLLRYERQKALAVTTTDTEAWYLETLHYVQALRDVPQQTGFPYEITWPTSAL